MTEEERMIPWITTEECLAFDWDAADANAPPVGIRYMALPRLAERVSCLQRGWQRRATVCSVSCSYHSLSIQAEEAKQFCSLAFTSERQESNFRESEALFNELMAKGLPVTTDIMNGCVFYSHSPPNSTTF